MSTTSVDDKNPNKTVTGIRNGAPEKVEGNVEISSNFSGTRRSRKEFFIADSHSSRRRESDEMEHANL